MKKFIVLLLSIVMLVLSACQAKDLSQNTASISSADSGTTSDGRKSEGNLYIDGYPIVKDKVSFKAVMAVQPYSNKLDEMEFFKSLEKKTNVHIEWTTYPIADYEQKKNLMLTSGDIPDIFYGTQALSANDLVKYSSQGIFVPLNDYIDKYAPNIKAAFQKEPDFKRLSTNADDGKIYAIGRAAQRSTQLFPDMIFIYKPWLEKLKLQVPTTPDELYNVLKAFKEKDPNDNGKADEIPFLQGNNTSFTIDGLFAPFGVGESFKKGVPHFVTTPEGKLIYAAKQPEFKEAVSFYSRFYMEGLFDVQGLVQKDETNLISKCQSDTPIVGSFTGFDPNVYNKPDRAKEYVIVPPLKNKNGETTWVRNDASFGNISQTGFTITKKCKDPEVAVRWADAHFEKTTSIEMFLGPEGINLEKKGDQYTYLPVPEGTTYIEFRFKNAPVHTIGSIFTDDWGKTVELMDEDKLKAPLIDQYFSKAKNFGTVGVKFTTEETKFVTTKGLDIDNYVQQSMMDWFTKGGIEQNWDSYIAQLNKMGLPNYEKIVQEAYKRFYNK